MRRMKFCIPVAETEVPVPAAFVAWIGNIRPIHNVLCESPALGGPNGPL
jgi:hypothetical protein